MALSDKRILEEVKAGNIVIDPFVPENLSTSSYDVTLGEYFFVEQHPHHFQNVYNLYNKKHTEDVWGTKPLRAETAEKVFERHKFEFRGISNWHLGKPSSATQTNLLVANTTSQP